MSRRMSFNPLSGLRHNPRHLQPNRQIYRLSNELSGLDNLRPHTLHNRLNYFQNQTSFRTFSDDIPSDQLFGGFKYTENLKEDIIELQKYGIHIDMNKVLGQGGFGTVYLGVHQNIPPNLTDTEGNRLYDIYEGKIFAAKLINSPFQYYDSDLRESIEIERIIMTQFRHKYLRGVYEVLFMGKLYSIPYSLYSIPKQIIDKNGTSVELTHFRSADRIIFLMEYSDLGDLNMFLDKSKPVLSQKQLLKLTYQLIEGLRHLHKNNIIHNDIKPKNVMFFTENGEIVAKLADFGLSTFGTFERNSDHMIHDMVFLGDCLARLSRNAIHSDKAIEEFHYKLVKALNNTFSPLEEVLVKCNYDSFMSSFK